ncbi:hypothetical protein E4U56_002515 [Claviceps arundinis]|uniref:Uncharacterized protein n=1 Tax=Claviceps arundinis TaxID=1623583 RepID=A0A9P7MP42_9HYPO|nr:hypothetical protein E4U56_002515 [Claviceps arundinis]
MDNSEDLDILLLPSPSPATACTNDDDALLAAPADTPPPAPVTPPESDTFTESRPGSTLYILPGVQHLRRLRDADPVGPRTELSLPEELDRHKVQMPDCSFDERGVLCYRNAVWANRKRRPAEQLRVDDRVWLILRNVSSEHTTWHSSRRSWPGHNLQAKYRVTKVIAPDHGCSRTTRNHRGGTAHVRRAAARRRGAHVRRAVQGDTWHVGKVGGNRRGRTYCANLTLTDAFREFVKKYGEGDDVGEAGTGGYTGSTGKKRKRRAVSLIQNIELKSSGITEDNADDP